MNLEGAMVKIRFKKYFAEQRQWVLIGKVMEINENWITVNGKGIIIQRMGCEVDEDVRVLVVPRDNIAHIRILPDNFNLGKITIITKEGRVFAKVPGGPDTSIDEEL